MKSRAPRFVSFTLPLMTLASILCATEIYAQKPQALPPKKKTSSSAQSSLGEGEAVQAVKEYLKEQEEKGEVDLTAPTETSVQKNSASQGSVQNSVQSTINSSDVSGAVAPVQIDSNESNATGALTSDAKPSSKETSRFESWLSSQPPRVTLLSGWRYVPSDLGERVGSSWIYGLAYGKSILPNAFLELRVTPSHHHQRVSGQRNRLHLFPIEFAFNFSKAFHNWEFFVDSSSGFMVWKSHAQRLLDKQESSAKGIDILFSSGLGARYQARKKDWGLGSSLHYSYVTGNFDSSYITLNIFAVYQY